MSNKTISLLEYEESKPLMKNELKDLEKFNKFIGIDVFTITARGGIKAKQYVGVCQIGNNTIEVLPKIFSKNDKLKDEQDEEQSKIRKNLLYMLSYTKNLKFKETDISSLSKNSTLFEAIIYLFAKNLIELLKIDLIRNYETREENSNLLKGKLLMSKHLRYNLFNKAKFYSQFDEFTEDNSLNKTFKLTIDKLLKFTQNSKNFKLLTECNLILQDVTLNKLSINDVEKVKFTRLNKQYENIFNLAKLLLFENSIDLNSKDTKTYSLMFDMNKLFEEFIFEFIRRNFQFRFENIQSEKPQKYLFIDSPKFILKPDITINCNKDNCELIIDTKYKKVNDIKSDKYGVSREDVYQMFVYSKVYNCKNIILLYPKYEKEIENVVFESEFNFKLHIKTVDLHIDLIKDKEKLKRELNTLLNIIQNDIKQ
ncbi:hypothetical protein H6501_02385 [Candidatus Woesearchaeota archaeon]|nr:hypothetical protein [Candidatus Woesearchaeota archaeon]USN44938.1 MAG: hypothetical protein H6500_03825 [Candidatus Woesearchaeota archaeon]